MFARGEFREVCDGRGHCHVVLYDWCFFLTAFWYYFRVSNSCDNVGTIATVQLKLVGIVARVNNLHVLIPPPFLYPLMLISLISLAHENTSKQTLARLFATSSLRVSTVDPKRAPRQEASHHMRLNARPHTSSGRPRQ